MKILTLDIETSPSVAHVWGLWKNNVSLSQLRESTQVICFAAKWHNEKRVMFHSDHHDGHDEMVLKAHSLVDEADAVVHYNGSSFDMPHLRREFLLAGLRPPSPAQDIDLLKTVRSQFRFISNKLDHVSQQLELGSKVKHAGHQLWIDCLAGDPKAWTRMKRYNVHDVRLTEQLYDRLLPWIKGHPHVGLYDSDGERVSRTCANCGGALIKQGFYYTRLSKFQQWSCKGCGAWSHSARAESRVDERGVS